MCMVYECVSDHHLLMCHCGTLHLEKIFGDTLLSISKIQADLANLLNV